MFNKQVQAMFENTEIMNMDFEELLACIHPSKKDLIFLDPPYDTEFSDYSGNPFKRKDQERLAACLEKTNAQFILIIKKTPFIESLYENMFRIVTFEKENRKWSEDRTAALLL